MTTPGMLRRFAREARKQAEDYHRWSHEAHDPERKRYFERCAEGREDHAEWYESLASRGEIMVEYSEATR